MKRWFFGFAVLAAACDPGEGDPVVAARKRQMQALDASLTIIAQSGGGPVDRMLAEIEARAVAEGAARIPALFAERRLPPEIPSRARAELWEQTNEFRDLAARLGRSATGLANAIKAGDFVGPLTQVEADCLACHRRFRLPDPNAKTR
ncbi:MAG: cytochrome c [Alphaproteobacteria bacterium]|nr:cytochrome c [Alphaproteobacteria bacterium]